MKKIYLLVSLLLSFVSIAQVSQNKNYIHHKVYKTPVQVGAESQLDEKSESVFYIDGSGRVKQKMAINAGSLKEDIIIYNETDNINRQKKVYLPYAKSGNNGAYINDFVTSSAAYYNSPKYDYTTNHYTEIIFHDAKLNKPAVVSQPGNEWKMSTGHTKKILNITNIAAEVRKYAVGYNTNNTPQLLYYGYYAKGQLTKEVYKNENWVPADNNNNTTQIFRDNDGRKVLMRNFNGSTPLDTYYVYDLHGNIVYMIPPIAKHNNLFSAEPVIHNIYNNMVQVFDMASSVSQSFVNNPGTGNITLTINNDVLTVNFNATFTTGTTIKFQNPTPSINNSLQLRTFVGNVDCSPNLPDLIKVSIDEGCNCLYLEQNYNYSSITGFNDVFTVNLNPNPQITPVTANQSVLDTLCYQYKYDSKNRQSEKKLPGTASQYIIYDIHNRPVLTQNAKQRNVDNTWLYTAYDPTGRVAYKGVAIDFNYPTLSQADMQQQVNLWQTFVTRSITSVNIGGDTHYYNKISNFYGWLTEVYYYDDYNFDIEDLYIPAVTSYNAKAISNTNGLLTGTKIRAGNEYAFSTSVFAYDRMDRLIFTESKSPFLNTKDATEYKIDFTGKVLETKMVHSKTGVITDLVTFDNFMYDHADRLLRHTRRTGKSATELITFNKYDELGNFAEKKTGRGATAIRTVGISVSRRNYIKSAATNSWTNNSLRSDTALIGNGSMSFIVATDIVNMRIGLSYSPDDTNYQQINYSLALTGVGSLIGGKEGRIYENGVEIAAFNYTVGDEFTIERIGSNIHYKQNNRLIYESENSATSQNLYADAHIYNRLGGFAELQINNYSYTTAVALETTKYKFNVQGNLTKINDPQVSSGSGLFNMEIKYTNPEDGTPFYNGNIAEIDWRTANDPVNVKRRYIYSYDYLHRYTKSSFSKKSGANTIAAGNYDEYINYNDNGNITSLIRYGTDDTNPILIDNLNYNYNGNQLQAVSDITNNPEGFNDRVNETVEYTYDNDGNLTSDKNKYIRDIMYNNLNLPEFIEFLYPGGGYKSIVFTYDALGVKLSKTVYDGTNTTITQYAGGNVYVKVNSNPFELQYISHPEGYVSHTGQGKFSYVYYYTDHVGSIRLSYTDADFNGIATASDIIEENNFYPFGLKHKGYNNTYMPMLGNAYNKMAFQGQEMIDEMELNWNSFAWRNFDPALGRFFNIDPLAEKYSFMSPYQFSSNQPVHAPELEGLESYNPEDDYSDYDYTAYNLWGRSAFDDSGNHIFTPDYDIAEVSINFINGERSYVDYDESEREETEGRGAEDILDGLSNLPGGGAIDMYRGIRDGDWLQFSIGTISLAADIFTGGGASLVKGAVVIGVKQGAKAFAKKAAKEAAEAAAKEGLTNAQLIQKSATLAERAIGGTGGVAGTAKHAYAKNLLSRFQSIYGDRGLSLGSNYFKGPAGKGFLDVVNHNTMTIYDFKFGNAVMSNAQYLKYSNSFPGYSIQIIRP